jgi:hypothetical protein
LILKALAFQEKLARDEHVPSIIHVKEVTQEITNTT